MHAMQITVAYDRRHNDCNVHVSDSAGLTRRMELTADLATQPGYAIRRKNIDVISEVLGKLSSGRR